MATFYFIIEKEKIHHVHLDDSGNDSFLLEKSQMKL